MKECLKSLGLVCLTRGLLEEIDIIGASVEVLVDDVVADPRWPRFAWVNNNIVESSYCYCA
jgi:hypothetical protein